MWSPLLTFSSPHYLIYSTATEAETKNAAKFAELLYSSYTGLLNIQAQDNQPPKQLKIKLFGSRQEFRFWSTSPRSWAEGYYHYPYTYQYVSTNEAHPYHWMLHELTHQLNKEVAGLELESWLDEGLATYFSTSKIEQGDLKLGSFNSDTYPVWWLSIIAVSGIKTEDINNASFIPLKIILQNHGGPSLNTYFNLYYLHWWTLVHFLFHGNQGSYRSAALNLLNKGGRISDFETDIGALSTIEEDWYTHIKQMKAAAKPT